MFGGLIESCIVWGVFLCALFLFLRKFYTLITIVNKEKSCGSDKENSCNCAKNTILKQLSPLGDKSKNKFNDLS